MGTRFGTIRKLPSGRYQARYSNPRTGKQVSLGRTFVRQQEAKDALKAVQADLVRGEWIDPAAGGITLRAWSTTWLASVQVRPRTHESYETALRVHVLDDLGDLKLTDLSATIIRDWHTTRKRAAGPSAVARAYSVLHNCLNAAVTDGLLRSNPCTVKGAATAPTPVSDRALTIDEVETVLAAMPDRYKVWFRAMVFGGFRWGESIALTVGDIDFAHGSVRVEKQLRLQAGGGWVVEPTKTGAGRRQVHLPDVVLAELAEHVTTYTTGHPQDRVFTTATGSPLQKGNFRQRVWLPATAGLSWQPTAHQLRHTCATFAIRAGADVLELQRMMGHSDPAITLRKYGHFFPGAGATVAAKMNEFASPTTV